MLYRKARHSLHQTDAPGKFLRFGSLPGQKLHISIHVLIRILCNLIAGGIGMLLSFRKRGNDVSECSTAAALRRKTLRTLVSAAQMMPAGTSGYSSASRG